ncbi:hypothetical protein B0H17DRAFT_886715, partial [Mycena rosella]
SFKRLKALFRWQDGWRTTFPDTRDYTCWQHRKDENTGLTVSSYSRIDRTLVDSQKFDQFRDWTIKHCSVITDHRLILTEITCRPEAQHGHGRWNMPLYLLKTPKFVDCVQQLAKDLLGAVEGIEHDENSDDDIQTLWAKFKAAVIDYGQHCTRYVTNEYTRNIRTWKAQLSIVIHDDDMPLADR